MQLEQTLYAVTSSSNPRHMSPDGFPDEEIKCVEWNSAQVRVGCLAVLEMMRPHRNLNDEDIRRGFPRIRDEELAFDLLQVNQLGIYESGDSLQNIGRHPEAGPILTSWLDHFGALFNIMCKQRNIPYETAASRIEHFQERLVENVQQLRRIYELHAAGAKETISAAESWASMEWGDTISIINESNGHSVEFLRQSVYIPHVVGDGVDTRLVLDPENELYSRQSAYVRLSPYGKRIPKQMHSE